MQNYTKKHAEAIKRLRFLPGRHSSHIVEVVAAIFFFFLPESQVLLQELDDALGVTEIVFLQLVDLVKGFLESFVGELACGLVVLHDFIMEDREVEGQTELDGVAGWECNNVCLVVSLERVLLYLFEEVAFGVLGDIAVVVTNHLDEEGLGLTVAALIEDFLFDHVNNALAVGGKLGLNV